MYPETFPALYAATFQQVRDITSDPKWLAAYEMEIPVLTVLSPWTGNEVRFFFSYTDVLQASFAEQNMCAYCLSRVFRVGPFIIMTC